MKNKQALIIAVALAFLVGLLMWYQRIQEEEKLRKGEELKDVLVAKQVIHQYSIVRPSMVRKEQVPAKYLQPGAISDYNDLLNEDGAPEWVATVVINKNEQIVGTKLTIPGQGTGLAVSVPQGKRAVTISVSGASAVAGLIKPGNKIDVIGTFKNMSVLLLQDLKVLAVGKTLQDDMYKKKKNNKSAGYMALEASGGGSSGLITVAASTTEALKIAYAEKVCSLRIILRSYADNTIVEKNKGFVDQRILLNQPKQQKREDVWIPGQRY